MYMTIDLMSWENRTFYGLVVHQDWSRQPPYLLHTEHKTFEQAKVDAVEVLGRYKLSNADAKLWVHVYKIRVKGYPHYQVTITDTGFKVMSPACLRSLSYGDEAIERELERHAQILESNGAVA